MSAAVLFAPDLASVIRSLAAFAVRSERAEALLRAAAAWVIGKGC